MESEIEIDDISPEEINELEEKRIEELNKAGIDEQEVLIKASKNINTWSAYFNENITRGKDDLNFLYRDQWTAVERSEFSRLFKPAMTFNKLYDATKKIIGEQRKNKPDLIVRSLTGRASQAQIDLRSDLVRTIAYQSQTDLVYQTAFKSALGMGFGAFQIGIEYESPKSFSKIIHYDIIPDPTRTFFDPTALKPHKGDGNFCGRLYVFTKDEFFATYPYITHPVSFIDPYMLLDFQWQTRDTIAVADYYIKEWFPIKILRLSNGQVVTELEWEELKKKYTEIRKITNGKEVDKLIGGSMPVVTSERMSEDYEVIHYRMLHNQIIDFERFPSKHLPLIFVDGDSSYIEGRQYTKSFIREARDAQKCVNYFGSEIAAEVKNRRREQWLGTPDNIAGYEQDWRNPELQMGILRAKPDPKTGQMPIKQTAWELSEGITQNFQRATQDIKEILGFSESEALQGRDISGKARRERKMEGSMSAYVFFDNLNQAIEQGGRVVNDLLSHIFDDDERHFVVNKKDGTSQTIIINEKLEDGSIKNDIGHGDFDVEIDTGPSFAVQKDIALEFLQQTIASNPETFPLVADLWAKNLDVQFMPQIADRFKTLVPPEILAKEEGKSPPPPKPNPQQIMMQMEMQSKQAKLQNDQKEIEIKMQQLKLDQSRLDLEKAKAQSDMQLNIFDHQADLRKSEIDHRITTRKHDLDFTSQMAKHLTDIHRDEQNKRKDSS